MARIDRPSVAADGGTETERLFEALAVLHDFLGLLGLIPEVGGRDLLFDFG